jgi:hypothetical protein
MARRRFRGERDEQPSEALLGEIAAATLPLQGGADLDPLLDRIGDARVV